MPEPEYGFPRGFEEHQREQLVFGLRYSTPLQRLDWVEETLQVLAPYLKDRSLPDDHPSNCGKIQQ